MADDILDELRFHIRAVQSSWDVTLHMLAADEIERLRCDLFMKNWRIEELADHIEELQEEINDLRLQVVTLSIPKEDHRG